MAYVNSSPSGVATGANLSPITSRDTLRPSGTVDREADGEVFLQVEVAFSLNRRAAAEREFLELARRLFVEVDAGAAMDGRKG